MSLVPNVDYFHLFNHDICDLIKRIVRRDFDDYNRDSKKWENTLLFYMRFANDNDYEYLKWNISEMTISDDTMEKLEHLLSRHKAKQILKYC